MLFTHYYKMNWNKMLQFFNDFIQAQFAEGCINDSFGLVN